MEAESQEDSQTCSMQAIRTEPHRFKALGRSPTSRSEAGTSTEMPEYGSLELSEPSVSHGGTVVGSSLRLNESTHRANLKGSLYQ